MSEPLRVVVYMEGGLVQDVRSMGLAVDVLVIDADTDGADQDELTTVDGDPAYVALHHVYANDAPNNVDELSKLFDELAVNACPKCRAMTGAKGEPYDGLCDSCGWDRAAEEYST